MSYEMQTAALDGVELAYLDTGVPENADREQAPVVLIHGFASKVAVNWTGTGWVDLLAREGRRVVAFDNRGHGASTKFYNAEDYGPDIFAADTLQLLDFLGIATADVMGYSMGARIAAWLAQAFPERVGKLVLSGMGDRLYKGGRSQTAIIEGLETGDPASITDATAKTFRAFADKTGSDRMALAACLRPSRAKITRDMVASIAAPTLVTVGSDDEVAGSAEELADVIPNARLFVIPGRDHMKSVGDPLHKRAVLEFLGGTSSE